MRGIKNLAQHLNLSIGTVSRALNDRPDVSADTRKRVLAAADELGYVANRSGQSLRQGTTNAIGFMIELNEKTSANGDDFFMQVFEGVTQVFRKHNLDLVVLPCATDNNPAGFLRRIVGQRLVDAVILSATQRHDERIEYLTQTEVPFVALGRSDTPGEYPWIDLDFEGYIDTSIDRLVGFGHHHIAISKPPSDVNLGEVVLDRYKLALARHGLPFRDEYVYRVDSSESGGYGLIGEVLATPEPPTAIILDYEPMAVGAYHRLNEMGLEPGRDLSIVGLRESPRARSLRPPLTSFRTSLIELGRELAHALLDIMPDSRNGAPQSRSGRPVRKLWPLELIPGESDGPVRQRL